MRLGKETGSGTGARRAARPGLPSPQVRRAEPPAPFRIIVLLAGLLLGQVMLYGPSLAGRRILLPLDLLGQPRRYLPLDAKAGPIEPKNLTLGDLVELFEPARRFAVSEMRSGRIPQWAPYQFGGAPFIWPKFSPFLLFECSTGSPLILAWGQLLEALVAGLGMYVFCRKVLGVSFWPGTVAAWCYPLTAFFVLWQGYPTALSVVWLPWLFVAIDRAMQGKAPMDVVWLSVVTCLTLVSGHLDVAGQVLLVGGLYGLWVLWQSRGGLARAAWRRAGVLGAGFGVGLLLAGPYILPAVEYARSGMRMERRNAGEEDRPPLGLRSLPELALPQIYGASTSPSIRVGELAESETPVAGYSGVLALLVAAPLGLAGRGRRGNGFWVLLSLLGLAWSMDIPGVVSVLRLPGLRMMSHNRLVFATAFGVLSLAALGLENLTQEFAACAAAVSPRGFSLSPSEGERGPSMCSPSHGPPNKLGEALNWRHWFWAPAGLLAGLYAWCAYRALHLPAAVSSGLEQSVRQSLAVGVVHDLDGARRAQDWFVTHHAVAAGLSGAGLALWVMLRWRPRSSGVVLACLAAGMLADLAWFGHDRVVQCEPSLYYPRIPALSAIADSAPGRVIGYRCLPASLASATGLNDIRGYDGVDPKRMVELERLASDGWFGGYPYAMTQWLSPRVNVATNGLAQLPPVLDLLGVRYVVFRGNPPPGTRAVYQSPDYWVAINPAVMPRVFVPQRVEVVTDSSTRLERLNLPGFDPRAVGCVETPAAVPEQCRGTGEITSETPTRIDIRLRMNTAGLAVLGDNWDKGWRAYLDGKPVRVLRVDHALRGVIAPAGESKLEFCYEPASFRWGLALFGAALLALFALFARRAFS